MANLTTFNNDLFGSLRVMKVNEDIWFIAKDVVQALGYDLETNSYTKYINLHCDKDDIMNYDRETQVCHRLELDYKELGQRGGLLINEPALYDLTFNSPLPEAKPFKKWVSHEVLPTIRQTGCYIAEHAQPEAIDFQSKFGNRRIRKTFREATDIESTWKQYKELSKIERDAHRINNRDRIRACDIIIDELSDYIANNTTSMKASKVILYKEVIEEVLNTKQLWTNKMYGGITSNMTVKINHLEQENQTLKQQVEELTPPEHEWITCPTHGFSENYRLSWSSTGQVTRSKAYNRWIYAFPVESVPDREYFEQCLGIDFNKEIVMEICYICKDDFDVKNFDKATIDMIFNQILGIDDKIVTKVISYKLGTCDSYNDGKIIFTIYNK